MIQSVNESGATAKTDAQLYDNVSDFVYYFIGCIMALIMLFGFSANLVILYTFSVNKKIRTMDNTLIIGLALSDIGQSIFGLPLVVIASFSKKWIFGQVLCQYYAFVTTCLGIAQIANLTVIAMERYFVIVRLDRRLTSTTCRSVFMILLSFVYGAVWALGPLLGWSKYKQEDIGIACCVTWEVKDKLSFSYTISICTFGWFIPLILITFGYISITRSIVKERNKRSNIRSQQALNKSNRERKVAITVLIMIGAFVVSWTPYSVVSLWSAIGDVYSIPTWVIVAPAVFAKCSIIWNPIIYVARHDHFRKAVYESLSILQCFKQINISTSFRTDFYNTSLKQTVVKTSQRTCDNSQKLLHQSLLQSFATNSPSSNIKGRSMSLTSYEVKSPSILRRGGLEKQPTLYSHVESSHEASSDCVKEHNDITTVEVNDKNLKDTVPLEDDVLEDIYEPNNLSKYVQTDICISDIILPFAVKKHNYSQTHRIGVSKRLTHYNLELVGGPKLFKTRSEIKREYNVEVTSPSKARQHEQPFKSKLCKCVTCHQPSLTENRQWKGTHLETLKQTRNFLKQKLEMMYMTQFNSKNYGHEVSNVNNEARRQLYCGHQVNAAQSMYDSTSKFDARQKRKIHGFDSISSYTWSRLSRPQCLTQNIETLEFTHYNSNMNYSRRQRGQLLSVGSSTKPSPKPHPFVKQTTV